ncbi:MAG: M15 family peptidase [Ilumatobacter sp.]|nr:MAG: M15 family peptidase [Ilumatobacter sp.]
MRPPDPEPRSPFRDRRSFLIGLAAASGLGGAAVAAGALATRLDGPAVSTVPAERLVRPARDGDVVTVFNVGQLRLEVATAVERAASAANGAWSPARSASVGLVAVRRGLQSVQRAPSGFRYPMVVTAMPAPVAGAVLDAEVGAVIASGDVAMSERTAGLRGARAGDRIDIVAADGRLQSFRVGLVAADVQVGGAELVMSNGAADRLGITRSTRAVMWGFSSRTAVESALAVNGIPGGISEVRAVRSWNPPNPDSTLGTARTKELLGEFAYRVNADGSMTQDASWVAANLPAERELLNASIRIRTRCHRVVVDDLRAALADVAAAGLAGAIDVANSNTFGGVHNPRFNRISGELGFVSRHAWAMALDVNTVTNCQGCVPQMHCEVVRIFRRHGFAWGGNFLRPDGMHFEWVGVRRDRISYPSEYCPNPISAQTQTVVTGDSRDLLFADDTFASGHDHAHDHG